MSFRIWEMEESLHSQIDTRTRTPEAWILRLWNLLFRYSRSSQTMTSRWRLTRWRRIWLRAGQTGTFKYRSSSTSPMTWLAMLTRTFWKSQFKPSTLMTKNCFQSLKMKMERISKKKLIKSSKSIWSILTNHLSNPLMPLLRSPCLTLSWCIRATNFCNQSITTN